MQAFDPLTQLEVLCDQSTSVPAPVRRGWFRGGGAPARAGRGARPVGDGVVGAVARDWSAVKYAFVAPVMAVFVSVNQSIL